MNYIDVLGLAQEFASKPTFATRRFRELCDGDSSEALDSFIRALCVLPESPGANHLIRLAVNEPRILSRSVDPGCLPSADAIQLVAKMQAIDPHTDVRLLQLLLDSTDAYCSPRLLEIVAEVSDGNRIRILLPRLLRHADARVRSKAALLIRRFSQNRGWLDQTLDDADPRVRANAIEALWGIESSSALRVFRTAAKEEHVRVAANGIVGLHRAGDLDAARLASSMARHCVANFRAAAAWAMGECQDARFLAVLGQMLEETEGPVRRNALRATVRIRKMIANLRAQGELQVSANLDHDNLAVGVRAADGSHVPALPATAFVVEGTEIVAVHRSNKSYKIALHDPQPLPMRVAVYAACGVGEQLAS